MDLPFSLAGIVATPLFGEQVCMFENEPNYEALDYFLSGEQITEARAQAKLTQVKKSAPQRERKNKKQHPNHNDFYKCSKCAQYLRSKENVRRHLMTHSVDDTYTCEECGGKFTKQGGLSLHISRAHTKKDVRNRQQPVQQKKEKQFQCDRCHAFFATQYSLDRHGKIIHQKGKSFTCHLCSIQFSTKHNYDLHNYKIHP